MLFSNIIDQILNVLQRLKSRATLEIYWHLLSLAPPGWEAMI